MTPSPTGGAETTAGLPLHAPLPLHASNEAAHQAFARRMSKPDHIVEAR